jgi:glucan endo-1,3-alpha-glucosidase
MASWPHSQSAQNWVARLSLCLLLCGSGFAQRIVFAHYMLANQDYEADDPSGERNIASYQREIRQAQAMGVDGFALNAGGWLKEPRYIRRASQMFEAAYRLHTGFRLMFSADMCCSNDADDLLDMMRRFAGNPRYAEICFKRDGKFVLTTFSGASHGVAFWTQLKSDLEAGGRPSSQTAPGALSYVSGIPSSAPVPLFLVPAFFWGGELPRREDIQHGLAEYRDLVDGLFYWGIAGVPGLGHPPDQLPSSEAYAAVAHASHKTYMAPICFQFWGANAGRNYDYSGYSGMRAMWLDAINATHPDWVEIITWNDFIEGTYISPIDDPARYTGANDLGASIAPPSTLHFFHSHRGATELMAFFIEWYKTGKQPAVRKDQIFWAYRTQMTIGHRNSGAAMSLYGPAEDAIYVTANLRSKAVLHVAIGNYSRTIALPAGSTDVRVPLVAGPAPRFELTRGSQRLAEGTGDDPIAMDAAYPNFYQSTGAIHD